MPKTTKYISRESKNGEFSGRLNAKNAAILDLYCKANGVMKSAMLNKIVEKWAEEQMARLKEPLL